MMQKVQFISIHHVFFFQPGSLSWDDTFETDDFYRDRIRVRCPIINCPYLDADSIPTRAIIPDMFTDKDKKHIEKFHPNC